MILTLTRQQAGIVLELLNKFVSCSVSSTGEIVSTVADIKIEWTEEEVELKVPDD